MDVLGDTELQLTNGARVELLPPPPPPPQPVSIAKVSTPSAFLTVLSWVLFLKKK
jgi:hypothetical protein